MLTRMRVRCHAFCMESPYPFADSTAARMLAEGLARAHDEHKLSIRQLGKRLGYKQAVVLSHMASGRVPIPLERAEDLAEALDLDKRTFAQAVIKQRYPSLSLHLVGSSELDGSDGLAAQLEATLGARLTSLTKEQRSVMREVAAEPHPRRRWLSVHEMFAIKVLRELFPEMATEGISEADLGTIQALFSE